MNALLIVLTIVGPHKWTPLHLGLAAAMVTSEALDASYSVDARRRGFGELNPLVHTSVGCQNTYSALALLGTLGIAAALPDKWRTVWLAGVTGLEIGRDFHSARLGLHLTTRL